MPHLIELTNIVKTYRMGETDQTVLKGIDFHVDAGERLALIGASGSGKTTLMNIIGLLDRVTTGKYLFNGQDVTSLSEEERAKVRNQTIGFVFQGFFLLPRLTVLQNVGLPLHYRNCSEAEIRERSLERIKLVGLEQRLDHRPNQLSGGQQQRVAIARALVGSPSLILADEPTGALDTETGQMIMDLLIKLNEEDKVTMVIVTHNPEIAEQCQRTVKIQDGKI